MGSLTIYMVKQLVVGDNMGVEWEDGHVNNSHAYVCMYVGEAHKYGILSLRALSSQITFITNLPTDIFTYATYLLKYLPRQLIQLSRLWTSLLI
jgi:hypothetical protein